MNVAIISPNQNAYSETFIQAHKKINAKVFYYFDGYIPKQLEGIGYIDINFGIFHRLIKKGLIYFFNKDLSYAEIVFAKSLKKNKIDIILAEYGVTGAELVNVCKRFKMPLVTIFHGADASAKNFIENYRLKYFDLFHYANKILAVSSVMQNKLISLGCPADKIIRATYGPDKKFLEIIPTFSELKTFVAIGRFIDKKAPYYTILAIKRVAEKHPDVKLYFAGDGELLNTCQNLIRYFRLNDNIKLLGIITPDEYIALLTKVTGFIQHSLTAANGDMEGTPVSILEASAAGIPVIATLHAGIPDVIIDGETGLLVDEHDVDGMATQIIKLIENPNLARRLGKNGKNNIEMNFSMEKHLRVIKSALSYPIG